MAQERWLEAKMWVVEDARPILYRRLTKMQTARNGMTTSICLEFCSTGKNGRAMRYAGLKHGMAHKVRSRDSYAKRWQVANAGAVKT